MASRRGTMMADAWLSGLNNGVSRDYLHEYAASLSAYLIKAGYPVTFAEAHTLIKDYLQRGTLLV